MKKIITSAMLCLTLFLCLSSCKNTESAPPEDLTELSSDSTVVAETAEEQIARETAEAQAEIQAISGISMDADSAESTESTSTNNWDETLDEYESFADKYIAALKKMKTGDMTAAKEMSNLQSQSESLSKKLQTAGSNLTKPQMKRFVALQNKFTNAAIDMQ